MKKVNKPTNVKSARVKIAEAKVRIAQRKLVEAKKALKEAELGEGHFVDLSDTFESDDDLYSVQLPAESKYAGKYLVYSISARDSWIAKGVIVDSAPEDVHSVNPFSSVAELKKDGILVIKQVKAEGVDDEPVVFTIAENESYVDYYGDGDDPITGEYFGDVNDYLDEIYYNEDSDDDYDDDEDW